MTNQQDELLRTIARDYVRRQGAELLQENQRLNTDPTPLDTTGLQQKVRRWQNKRKRKRLLTAISSLAACGLLVFVLFRTVGRPSHVAPGNTPSAEVTPIALNFTLPDEFTQAGMEQDNEKTVYYLDSRMDDPVVLVLERGDVLSDTKNLIPVKLGDETGFARQTDHYSLLTFCKENVVYTLTCQHDINTLARLSEAIL